MSDVEIDDIENSNNNKSELGSKITAGFFATSTISIHIVIFCIFFNLLVIKKQETPGFWTELGHTIFYFILAIAVVSSVGFILLTTMAYPDKYIGKAIDVIIDNYEDITTITIMQLFLMGLYYIMDRKQKVHEKFILYMALTVISIIRLLLLALKSNLTFYNFPKWSFSKVDEEIKEKIRYSNELEIYKCDNGEPTTTIDPVLCVNDKPEINRDFFEDDDDAFTIDIFGYKNVKLNTFFWVKLYYYILIVITIASILFYIIEFFESYKNSDCIINEKIKQDNSQVSFIRRLIEYLAPSNMYRKGIRNNPI